MGENQIFSGCDARTAVSPYVAMFLALPQGGSIVRWTWPGRCWTTRTLSRLGWTRDGVCGTRFTSACWSSDVWARGDWYHLGDQPARPPAEQQSARQREAATDYRGVYAPAKLCPARSDALPQSVFCQQDGAYGERAVIPKMSRCITSSSPCTRKPLQIRRRQYWPKTS